jgi:hypothetical protein
MPARITSSRPTWSTEQDPCQKKNLAVTVSLGNHLALATGQGSCRGCLLASVNVLRGENKITKHYKVIENAMLCKRCEFYEKSKRINFEFVKNIELPV